MLLRRVLYSTQPPAYRRVGASNQRVFTSEDRPTYCHQSVHCCLLRHNKTPACTATVGGGSNVTYRWDFGDGQSGNGAIVQHTYAASGEYTALVSATNSVGQVTATTPVMITAVQPAALLYLPVVQR